MKGEGSQDVELARIEDCRIDEDYKEDESMKIADLEI